MGQQCVASRPRTLPVVVAALLVFALAVSTAASKLDALRLSELTVSSPTPQPVCVPSGYCFRLMSDRIERIGSVHRVALRIMGADNVYRLAKEVDEGRLRPIVKGTDAASVRLRPDYPPYLNMDEVVREIGAFLEFDRRPTGRLEVAFEHGGLASGSIALDVRRTSIGKLGSLLVAAAELRRRAHGVGPRHSIACRSVERARGPSLGALDIWHGFRRLPFSALHRDPSSGLDCLNPAAHAGLAGNSVAMAGDSERAERPLELALGQR